MFLVLLQHFQIDHDLTSLGAGGGGVMAQSFATPIKVNLCD